MSNETQMQETTKRCPFCGEEILATAIKCKHCGEFLEKQPVDKIDSLNVSEGWKERFRLIEKYYGGGYFPNANFKMLSIKDRYKTNFKIFSWSAIFGPLFYLNKGMWLKGLLYLALTLVATSGWWIAMCMAPWDYYRCKVLGKQL